MIELEVKNLGNRFHQQRLGQAGRAGDEAMATGEERDEQFLNHGVLADDGLAQLGLDGGVALDELLDRLGLGGLGGGVGFSFHQCVMA